MASCPITSQRSIPTLSDAARRPVTVGGCGSSCFLSDDGCQEMIAETAVLRLVALLAVNLTSRLPKNIDSTVAIRRARDRIDADPAAPLTLASLAADSGSSRYQLLRAFAREIGMTPHAYIVQQRLALARRMMRAGSALVDAASAAGFSDQSHFTRAFGRQFGVTPARYRAGAA